MAKNLLKQTGSTQSVDNLQPVQFWMNRDLRSVCLAAQSIVGLTIQDFQFFLEQVDNEDFDPYLLRQKIEFLGIAKRKLPTDKWRLCMDKRCKVRLENEDFELSAKFRGVAQTKINAKVHFLDVLYCYWLSKMIYGSCIAELNDPKMGKYYKYLIEGSNDESTYKIWWRQNGYLLMVYVLGWPASSTRNGKSTGTVLVESPPLSLSKKHDVNFGSVPKVSIRDVVEKDVANSKTAVDYTLLPHRGSKALGAYRTGPSL